MSEFFPSQYRDGDTFFSELFIGEAQVKNGHIELSDAPGFGIELNDALIEREGLLLT
jgi:L-alanine-DL-glutamate epimerase-like enolase superfamily enzyme